MILCQNEFMKTNKKTTLNCEQVYEIWRNEPDLISIIDTRPLAEFKFMHIPGSKHLEWDQISNHLETLGNKLAVIVADETLHQRIEQLLIERDNFILVKNFSRWNAITKENLTLTPVVNNGIMEVSCENTLENINTARLIDVRRPDEYTGELGHTKNAELITLGEELSHFLLNADKDQPIIFVCRSGMRSAKATAEAQEMGFKNVYNMMGGMIRWNELNLPLEK